ncbi:AAA family ATPase [Anaerobacillus sp. MEB173]|uniref:ATP-binding protein n=1 Tax=Anaerobacillus sp. MEB173 TaxID=3383345 RepID=UPI003F915E50
MRITSLHIYGFGKLEDVYIQSLSPKLQIFYGENEAGKSTIMAFIRCILFGFPTRQQSELRYEPKRGSKYGGKITLVMKDGETISIERIAGKATGKVTVYYENGSVAGEEALPSIYAGMDRSLFQGIFAFDLDGLQGMEQLKSDDLGHYLYGVGLTGDVSLVEIEKKLERVQGELYKPNGKKPVLNQQVQKLRQIEEELKQKQQNNSSYQQLINEKANAISEMNRIDRDISRLKQEVRCFEQLQSLEPLVKEKNVLQLQLSQLPVCEPFPEDGLDRLEQFKSHLLNLEEELLEVEKMMSQLSVEMDNIIFNDEWLSLEYEVKKIRENLRYYKAKKEEINQKKKAIIDQNEEISALMDRIGTTLSEETIMDCDTGYIAKEKLKVIIHERNSLIQRLEIVQAEVEKFELEINSTENKLYSLQQKIIPESLKEEMINRQQVSERDRKLDQSIEQLSKQLEQLKQSEESTKSPLILLSTAIILLLGIWQLVNQQWVIAVMMLIIGTILFLLQQGRKRNSSLTNLISKLEKEKQQLQEEKGTNRGHVSIDEHVILKERQMLEENVSVEQQVAYYQLKAKDHRQSYALASTQEDQYKYQLRESDELFFKWCNDYHFPPLFSLDHALDLVEMIEQLKARYRMRNRIETEILQLEEELETAESDIRHLCNVFQLPYEQEHFRLVEKMTSMIEDDKQQKEKQRTLREKIKEWNQRHIVIKEKIIQYEQRCDELFGQGECSDENSFRVKAKAWKESRMLLEKIALMTHQMVIVLKEEKQMEQVEQQIMDNKENYGDQIAKHESLINKLEEEYKQYAFQKSKLDFTLQELEKGTSYSEKLHEFANLKGQFQEGARSWAVYSVAKKLLKDAKAIYENERQPKVIQEAVKYFQIMTNHQYVKLYAPVGEERFIVERYDGVRFNPNELSKGTAEQLYLCLRLALANVYPSSSPFPIIMDDVLVNFDEERRNRAIVVIEEIAHHHQILFFTCHDHIVQAFKEKEGHVLDLEKEFSQS